MKNILPLMFLLASISPGFAQENGSTKSAQQSDQQMIKEFREVWDSIMEKPDAKVANSWLKNRKELADNKNKLEKKDELTPADVDALLKAIAKNLEELGKIRKPLVEKLGDKVDLLEPSFDKLSIMYKEIGEISVDPDQLGARRRRIEEYEREKEELGATLKEMRDDIKYWKRRIKSDKKDLKKYYGADYEDYSQITESNVKHYDEIKTLIGYLLDAEELLEETLKELDELDKRFREDLRTAPPLMNRGQPPQLGSNPPNPRSIGIVNPDELEIYDPDNSVSYLVQQDDYGMSVLEIGGVSIGGKAIAPTTNTPSIYEPGGAFTIGYDAPPLVTDDEGITAFCPFVSVDIFGQGFDTGTQLNQIGGLNQVSNGFFGLNLIAGGRLYRQIGERNAVFIQGGAMLRYATTNLTLDPFDPTKTQSIVNTFEEDDLGGGFLIGAGVARQTRRGNVVRVSVNLESYETDIATGNDRQESQITVGLELLLRRQQTPQRWFN